ncbi:hypothetical protein lerEdw1_009072 [Lerista edwardsae]|nr:hypothetical protein lerEdw1_009072 [Lerista edwardsae]
MSHLLATSKAYSKLIKCPFPTAEWKRRERYWRRKLQLPACNGTGHPRLFSLRSCFSPRGFNMAVFVDLNIPYLPEKTSLQKLVEAAAHLGYSTVAINYVVDYEENKKEIIKPVSPTELFSSLPVVQGKSKPIKILSRLTLVVSDPSHCNILVRSQCSLQTVLPHSESSGLGSFMLDTERLQQKDSFCSSRATSTNIKFYDIFAVFPKNGKLFHVACTTLDIDLVCINVTEKLPFYIKRPSVNVAIERGIYFELVYVPAIKDSTMRRYTISNALSLMQICRGKSLQLRGPYDVANLSFLELASVSGLALTVAVAALLELDPSTCLPVLRVRLLNDIGSGWLLGLSESNAKAAVSTNGRAVLLHGEARKTASGVVYTKKKPRPPEEEDSTPVSKKAKTAL